MNIYVSNLSAILNSQDLTKHFSRYGTVASANIVTDKFTNQSKGFAFIEMPDDREAQKAITELNGTLLDGRSIVVNEARPRKDRY
ncbi:RNA recognition motif domain-containing protein [Chitinophaga sp. GCM10012297]|uniref:RNA-binding protein n=1 Tax=Chitinophaga chungangae TaxID=2821488 RepID=A0ABS3YBT0_9BACT|nr:RNA-binding protein [Chitinophaga chungangae]MBO9152136.1 RNA-binding protein [Chitinophaga chungangae]